LTARRVSACCSCSTASSVTKKTTSISPGGTTARRPTATGLTPSSPSWAGEESNHVLVPHDGSRASFPAIYWRKANAVHGWFVDNCQDGVDECQETPVHPEQLAALHSTCQRALAAYAAGDLDVAAEILSPRAGFFFGSTDVDEFWAQDVEHTVREIERVITAAARIDGVVEFSYRSSW
jgi:hypothetical protein